MRDLRDEVDDATTPRAPRWSAADAARRPDWRCVQRNGARLSGASDSGRIEQPIERIGKAQGRRGPERQARIDIAEQAAQRRAQHEAGAEGRADLAEHRGAPLRRRDVGDIGKGGRDAGRGDAGDHAADEQPDQRRRQRHQHIVGREPEIRQQHHRPPPEAIRQRAEHRREHELHQRPGGAEQAEDARRVRRVVVDEALDQLWQDRHDHAEREHVEQDGDEDEGDRAAPDRRSALRHRLAGVVAHDGRLRLCANGLAFSRR